ncbi:MAG: ribosome biogenesis GTP-binding protein YihA/YsxC [Wenzhouxiangellaceae bacterium]
MRPIQALLRAAEYETSVHNWSQLPPDEAVEVAIAGRSNSGKSSLINRLCGRKALARTSRTPGRTQQLVLFGLGSGCRIVDLPGYGYAAVGADLRRHWQALIERYFRERRSLAGLVIVMDIRHPLKDLDLQLIDYARARELPVHLCLSKADKLGHGKRVQTLRAVAQRVGSAGVSVQLFSATTGLGVDELEQCLGHWFGLDEAGAVSDRA